MKKWKLYILSCIWSPLLAAQIVLVFIFGMVNEVGLDIVMYIGLVIWGISFIFGWLPILVFKRKGGVPKGKSFVHTTVLVDSGLYSIVRHPQYTAGILFSLALVLISQSWLITAMGVIIITLLYVDILMADKLEVEKFGDDYKRYMKKVPGTNFILGIFRQLRR
ncbi:MAG: isoprenylcysteine carboxylmethyltransferase family protein [Bacteroidales bacterium]|nr:isoprenylcysteine carboxylmethyltransferase family protein [Bacteroidales bacterium]